MYNNRMVLKQGIGSGTPYACSSAATSHTWIWARSASQDMGHIVSTMSPSYLYGAFPSRQVSGTARYVSVRSGCFPLPSHPGGFFQVVMYVSSLRN